MWMFIYWFDFVKLGDNFCYYGYDFEDIMFVYNVFYVGGLFYR